MRENEKKLCNDCGSSELRKNQRICEKCYNIKQKMFLELDKVRNTFTPEIDKITDRIYLGNYDGQRELNKLTSYGITDILICGNFFQQFYKDQFSYNVIEIDDNIEQNIIDLFEKTYEIIDNSDKIFVHCGSGVSRGPSFVIAYLIKKNGWTYENAFKFVEDKRYIIDPNPYFVDQLKLYESQIL